MEEIGHSPETVDRSLGLVSPFGSTLVIISEVGYPVTVASGPVWKLQLNNNSDNLIDKTILSGNLIEYSLELEEKDEILIVDNVEQTLSIYNLEESGSNWAIRLVDVQFPVFGNPDYAFSCDESFCGFGRITISNIDGSELDHIAIASTFGGMYFLSAIAAQTESDFRFGPSEQDTGDLRGPPIFGFRGGLGYTRWARYSDSSVSLVPERVHTPIQILNSLTIPPFNGDGVDKLFFYENVGINYFKGQFTYSDVGTVSLDEYLERILAGCPSRSVLPYSLRSCEPVPIDLDLDPSNGGATERYEMISLTNCNGRNYVSREKAQSTTLVGHAENDMANCSVFSQTAALETMMGVRLSHHVPSTTDHPPLDFLPIDFSEGYYDFSGAETDSRVEGNGEERENSLGVKYWARLWEATTLGAYLPEPEQYKSWSSTEDEFRAAAMMRRFGVSSANRDPSIDDRPYSGDCERLTKNKDIGDCLFALAMKQKTIFYSPYKKNGEKDSFKIGMKCIDVKTGLPATCPAGVSGSNVAFPGWRDDVQPDYDAIDSEVMYYLRHGFPIVTTMWWPGSKWSRSVKQPPGFPYIFILRESNDITQYEFDPTIESCNHMEYAINNGFVGTLCLDAGGHSVLIVGYLKGANGKDYYIIKNSYGRESVGESLFLFQTPGSSDDIDAPSSSRRIFPFFNRVARFEVFRNMYPIQIDTNQFPVDIYDDLTWDDSLIMSDVDQDGIIDVVDMCPFDADPKQEDQDGDFIGDACDDCWGVCTACASYYDRYQFSSDPFLDYGTSPSGTVTDIWWVPPACDSSVDPVLSASERNGYDDIPSSMSCKNEYGIPMESGGPVGCCDYDGKLGSTETDIDCGGACNPCELGQRCLIDADCLSENCVNGKCMALGSLDSCNESVALDLGHDGNARTVPNDACLKVQDGYPTWWGMRGMVIQAVSGNGYPVHFSWESQCTGNEGSAVLDAPWYQYSLFSTSSECATVVRLLGKGDGDVTIRYYADNSSICGNWLLEDGEECDDGNTLNGDDCSSNCQIAQDGTCNDGVQNGEEFGIDCGGACPICNQCVDDGDCGSGYCEQGVCFVWSPECDESVAVDLGHDGTNVTVPNNGCVMIRDWYPEWWGSRAMLLQNTTGEEFPVPVTWINTCSETVGGSMFNGNWQTLVINPTSDECTTLINLHGSGNDAITLRYYGG